VRTDAGIDVEVLVADTDAAIWSDPLACPASPTIALQSEPSFVKKEDLAVREGQKSLGCFSSFLKAS